MFRWLIRMVSFVLGLLAVPVLSLAQTNTTRIYGSVHDSNGAVVSGATVWLKDTSKGAVTDGKGTFSFQAELDKRRTLVISSIGYGQHYIELTDHIAYPIDVVIDEKDYSIEEVTIRPTKERYSRKNNQALELAREIIDRRAVDNPFATHFVSRERHESLTMALDNFTSDKLKTAPFDKFAFLCDYIDTLEYTGNQALAVSAKETLSSEYFQPKPSKERKIIHVRCRSGVDDFLPNDEIEASINATICDIDPFGERIIMMHKEFTSPFAPYAPLVYRYYIADTVLVDGEQCIDLNFVPSNQESLGFTGHALIDCNSHNVKSLKMEIPARANLNFVRSMTIEQEYAWDGLHGRLPVRESIRALYALTDQMDGLFCERQVLYSNYLFDNGVDREPFTIEATTVDASANSNITEWDFTAPMTVYDSRMISSIEADAIPAMLDRLRQIPLYYWTEQVINVLFSGFIPVKKENTPFYIGPVNTWVSYNGLEGVRLKFGGMTTASLNRHLFGTAYLIYGMADERFKYFGRLEYSFQPKKEQWNEFPIRSLRLQYEDDIRQYGQQYAYTNKDNALLSLRRRPDNMSGYVKSSELTYTNERYSGLTFTATLRNRINESTRFIPMVKNDQSGKTVSSISQTELELGLRYAPHEQFVQHKWNRKSKTPQYPVFTLTHSMSCKGILGSDYSMQHTEFSYRQKLMVGPLGNFNVMLKAGRIWGQVPYPLLIMPDANLSYTYRKESFETMTPMEFIMDKHVTWDVVYHMNGLVLNRIPLINSMKLRELLYFRGTCGWLDDRNNPLLTSSSLIFRFPLESSPAIGTMVNGKPFIEIGAGIDNIFKIMSVQAFRRMTYLNTPDTDLWGIRIEVGLEY